VCPLAALENGILDAQLYTGWILCMCQDIKAVIKEAAV